MKPKETKKTLEDHLIEKIKESGYPLEIEISNLLDNDYVVFNTQYYFDDEAKQGRDIDIYALPMHFERDEALVEMKKQLEPLGLRTDIAVECKKSETHAWVFYNRQTIPVSGYQISGQYKTSVPKPRRFSADSFDWMFQECLTLHYYEFDRIAIAYDEIKKKRGNSSRREIFEAVNQLVKFVCYEMHQIRDRTSKLPKTSSDREFIMIIFPIIVFDGDMFEVSFDFGEPRLQRKSHIILATHHRCPYCQKVESFTVDIVNRSYFGEFMKILKADFIKVRKNMLQKHDELVKKAKEIKTKPETEIEKSFFS